MPMPYVCLMETQHALFDGVFGNLLWRAFHKIDMPLDQSHKSRGTRKNGHIKLALLLGKSVQLLPDHCKCLHPGVAASQKLHWLIRLQMHLQHFWPGDLDLWPMTLVFENDLDILPFDLHVEIQGCLFVRSPVRVIHTDTHTDTHTERQTMSKLLHPSLTRDVKIKEMKQVWHIHRL